MSGWSSQSNEVSKRAIIGIGIVIALLIFLYLAHLFTLQIVEGYEYRNRAQEITRRSRAIHAQRGRIFDREGDAVALNRDSFVLTLNPSEVGSGEFDQLFNRLSVATDLSMSQLGQLVPMSARNRFTDIELVSGVDFETITYIAERIDEFPGVSWHNEPRRYYPDEELLSHVLGYVGEITSRELQVLYNRGYTPQSILGKSGIERQYDTILRGREGEQYRTVDVFGREISRDPEQIPPEFGSDLVLTIDRDIQELALRSLGDRSGAVVVLQVATGDVLALASNPGFDANEFMYGDNQGVFESLTNDSRFPFLNRAIAAEAPPASTFKTVMATAALEEEVLDEDDTIDAQAVYRAGDQEFREWGTEMRSRGFGPINIKEAIANSSNYFFYTVGHEMLGVENIAQYARIFGFGEPTGIDIPGERPGLVASRRWKEQTQNEPWTGGDTVNMSIGQGFTATTPLQLANMMAMVANRGTIYRPHLVREVRDPMTGEMSARTQPEILHSAPVRESTFDLVAEGLREVVTSGTARNTITTPAVESAGKTGTGEIGQEDRWHSWYVAFAPYEPEDPMDQVAIAVLVDADNEYDFWSPKAANLVLHGIFTDQNFDEVVEDLRPWYMYQY
ncbi:MAG: penicillin-binding protein 2 [Spirochaetota bacterium]